VRRVVLAVAVAAAVVVARGAAADDVPYPAQLANLVTGMRAAVLHLPARTPADELLLSGPITRLSAVSVGEGPAPIGVVSRSWEKGLAVDRRYLKAPDGLAGDVDSLLTWWHQDQGRARVRAVAPPDVFKHADDAVEEYNDALLDQAIALVSRRLDRYEVKYGPGSPKLNFVEVLLNTFVQSTKPFRPNHDGPSPNELLLGYSTSWGTVSDDKAQAVSTLEVGWRRYNLDWHAGTARGWSALLRPRYVAGGVAMAEARDGALRWPLNGAADQTTRVGPFLSFGDLKVAYLFGPESRFLVSRQVQLLPNLF